MNIRRFEEQFNEIQKKHDARNKPLPSGSILVEINDFQLPSGWNASKTTVGFLLPAGYPFASPYGFHADKDLRLERFNAFPQAAFIDKPIETDLERLIFKWKVTSWDVIRNDLRSYIGAIRNRFNEIK